MTTRATPMIKGRQAAFVWVVAGIALVVVGAVVWSRVRGGFFGNGAVSILAGAGYSVSLVAFVVSGALIVSRQPGNIIGWLLMIPGLALPASELITDWLVALNPPSASPDVLIWLAVWFVNWSWILLIYPIFHLLLVFPTGRPLSPRWRWAVAVELGMAAFMLFVATFANRLSVTIDETVVWSITNPIGFIPDALFDDAFGVVWGLGLIGLSVAGVTAFVKRFRMGSQFERQQLKWPLYALVLFGLVYAFGVATGALDSGSVGDAAFGLSLAAIPVSVAIAILRYRLYELDRIVSRTFTYVVVAAFLIGAYGLAVLALGSFLGRENPVAVAGATLAAATLFNPARTKVRRWVDRRFNRTRYDAELVIDEFTATLRDRVNIEEVLDNMLGVVSETMKPATAGVWVRRTSAS